METFSFSGNVLIDAAITIRRLLLGNPYHIDGSYAQYGEFEKLITVFYEHWNNPPLGTYGSEHAVQNLWQHILDGDQFIDLASKIDEIDYSEPHRVLLDVQTVLKLLREKGKTPERADKFLLNIINDVCAFSDEDMLRFTIEAKSTKLPVASINRVDKLRKDKLKQSNPKVTANFPKGNPNPIPQNAQQAQAASKNKPRSINVLKYFDGKSFLPPVLAKDIIDTMPCFYLGSKLYAYRNGFFDINGSEYVRKEVQDILGDFWKKDHPDHTTTWIAHKYPIREEDINKHEGYINCKNGMLNLLTLKLEPHDAKYNSVAQIPVDYNPFVNTTIVDEFVAAIIPDDCIDFFWEFVASPFFYNKYWPKAFLALVGSGDSGKSTLLETLRLFYGEKNCKAMSMQMIADNQFATRFLFGSLVNIYSDLNQSEAQDVGRIKTLTGGVDKISCDVKHGDPFEFYNRARMIFSSNHYPAVRSPDDPYFKRAHIIPCNNQFSPEKADPDILHKVTSDQGLQSMLMRVIGGYNRLLVNRKFTPSTSVDEERSKYKTEADSVYGFVHSATSFDGVSCVPKETMYQLYVSWCKSRGRTHFKDTGFYQRMAENRNRFGLEEERTRDYLGTDNQTFKNCYKGRKIIIDAVSMIL